MLILGRQISVSLNTLQMQCLENREPSSESRKDLKGFSRVMKSELVLENHRYSTEDQEQYGDGGGWGLKRGQSVGGG